MATSRILTVINLSIAQLAAIPFDWDEQQVVRPNFLCQGISMWNNQAKYAEDGKGFPFNTPAVFLELPPQEYQPLASGSGIVDLTLRIHLVDRQLDSGDGLFDQNLEVYSYRDLIKANMVLFQPMYCSRLFATHEHQDYDHDSLFHYVLDLKCAFVDSKGSEYDPDATTIIFLDPSPQFNLELDTSFDTNPNDF